MSLHHKVLARIYKVFPSVRTYERVGCPYFLTPLDLAGPTEERLLRLVMKAHQRGHELLEELRFRLWLLKLRLFR